MHLPCIKSLQLIGILLKQQSLKESRNNEAQKNLHIDEIFVS